MNTDSNFVMRYVDEILSDSTCRLDVIYWKDFAIDFNSKSKFRPMCLADLGDIRHELLTDQPILKENYYTFKITYTGNVVLNEPIKCEDIKGIKKIVKSGDIVFSRINCCRGSIGIIKDFQDDAICTTETYVFTVTNTKVDPRYLHIVLRHPYYQDRILSKCTGASLERKRFPEDELMEFEIPVPSPDKQLDLIARVKNHNKLIKESIEEIQRLHLERNSYIMKELGVDLVFSQPDENFYALPISDVLSNNDIRFDFDHNRPSFTTMIEKLHECKYPLVEINEIISQEIKSGSTPDGAIYPTKGIVFLKGGNIIENGIDLTNHEYVTPEFHEKLKRSQLKGNEVLVTIAGTVGKAGFNEQLKDANVNQAIAILKLKDNVLPLFVSSFLNSDGGRVQFSKYRHDFGTPNINVTELGKLLIPLIPDFKTQEGIVSKVKEFENQIKKEKEKSTENKRLKSEIVTEFLLGKRQYKNMLQRLK